MKQVIGHIIRDDKTIGWVITTQPDPPDILGHRIFRTFQEAQRALQTGIPRGFRQGCLCGNTVTGYLVFAFYPDLGTIGTAAMWEIGACLSCGAVITIDANGVPVDNIPDGEELNKSALTPGDRVLCSGPWMLATEAVYKGAAPNDAGVDVDIGGRVHRYRWKTDITYFCAIPLY